MAQTPFNILSLPHRETLCGLLTRFHHASEEFDTNWKAAEKHLQEAQERVQQSQQLLRNSARVKPLSVRQCEDHFASDIKEKEAYANYGKALFAGLAKFESLQQEFREFIENKEGPPLNKEAIAGTPNLQLIRLLDGSAGDAIFPYVKRFVDDPNLFMAGENRDAFTRMINPNTQARRTLNDELIKRMKQDGTPDSAQMKAYMAGEYGQRMHALNEEHQQCEMKLLDAERRANTVMSTHEHLRLGPIQLLKQLNSRTL